MSVADFTDRKRRVEELLVELESPLTMSMFLTQADLYAEAMRQRKEAAAMLREVTGLERAPKS